MLVLTWVRAGLFHRSVISLRFSGRSSSCSAWLASSRLRQNGSIHTGLALQRQTAVYSQWALIKKKRKKKYHVWHLTACQIYYQTDIMGSSFIVALSDEIVLDVTWTHSASFLLLRGLSMKTRMFDDTEKVIWDHKSSLLNIFANNNWTQVEVFTDEL